MSEPFLSMWVVYNRPKNYPDFIVARRHDLLNDKTTVATNDAIFAPTVSAIRLHMMEKGLTKLDRLADDDPVIMEVWL